LLDYVEAGGLLVVAASASRVVFGLVFDDNEDWADMNALVEQFGVVYEEGGFSSSRARVDVAHPVLDGVSSLALMPDNALAFSVERGEVLAAIGEAHVAAIVDYGDAGGQVLVLADVALLGLQGPAPEEPKNLDFLRSLAHYAANR